MSETLTSSKTANPKRCGDRAGSGRMENPKNSKETVMILLSKDNFQGQRAKAFLERLANCRRAHVSNLFLEQVRYGVRDPEEIVHRVWNHVKAKGTHSTYQADQIKYQEYATAIEAQPEEAILYARYCVAWESLPREERERQKEARSKQYREQWMASKPPTEPQIRYLKAMGYRGEITDRHQASELITKLKKGVA